MFLHKQENLEIMVSEEKVVLCLGPMFLIQELKAQMALLGNHQDMAEMGRMFLHQVALLFLHQLMEKEDRLMDIRHHIDFYLPMTPLVLVHLTLLALEEAEGLYLYLMKEKVVTAVPVLS